METCCILQGVFLVIFGYCFYVCLISKKNKQFAVPLAFIYCLLFYIDALMEYTKGEFAVTGANATANIFASYPAKHLSILNGFLDQVGLTTNSIYE